MQILTAFMMHSGDLFQVHKGNFGEPIPADIELT